MGYPFTISSNAARPILFVAMLFFTMTAIMYGLFEHASQENPELFFLGCFLCIMGHYFFWPQLNQWLKTMTKSSNRIMQDAFSKSHDQLLNAKTLSHVLFAADTLFKKIGGNQSFGQLLYQNGMKIGLNESKSDDHHAHHEDRVYKQSHSIHIYKKNDGVCLDIKLKRQNYFYGWFYVTFPNRQWTFLKNQEKKLQLFADNCINAIAFMFLCDDINTNIQQFTNANEFLSRALLKSDGEILENILDQFKESMNFSSIILPMLQHYGLDWSLSTEHTQRTISKYIRHLNLPLLFESPYDPIYISKTDVLYQVFEPILAHFDAHECYLLPIVQNELFYGYAIGFYQFGHDRIDMNLLSIITKQVSSILCRAIVNKKIIQTKQFYQDVIDCLSSIIVVLDAKLNIQFSNLYFKTFFNKDYAHFDELIQDHPGLEVIHKIKEYADTELTVPLNQHHFKVSLRYLMNNNIILLLTNVTDLIKIQQSISTSSKLKGIGTFVAGVAHEIKNPLVAVKTFTQLVSKDWKNQDIREKCRHIVLPQLHRINQLAQSLDYSDWVEKSTFEPLNLSKIVHKTKELLLMDSRFDARVSMTFDIDHQVMVFANQMALEQVFINLALNAMDAVRHCESPTISFRMNTDALTKVIVDIEDNGNGIEKQNQHHLFDPFFTTKDDGTGLGLSIVYQIMSDHQGSIKLHKSDTTGTVFRMVLPTLLRPKMQLKSS